jgi:uncharacterized membrane protein
MKLLYLTLALEWPFLVVALALSSWGLSFIIDQRDYKRGSLFPEYGNQIITYTSTWLSTSTSNATPINTIARSTYTVTATLSPNEYGTAYYSSVYSRIGSIPPFQTITKRAAIPTQAPTNDKRAYWADHSTEYTNVYGSLDGDPRSFVAAMVIPFSLLVASLAVRILITVIYFAHLRFTHLTQKAKHQWNEALVSLTAIFIVVLWGSTISSLSLYGSYYNDTISQSVGLLVTIVFCSISCISSVFALVFMCMELHKSKKGNQLQNEKNTFTRESIASDTSSA